MNHGARFNQAINQPAGADAGTSVVWKYKAVYRFNGQQASQCSDAATIGVMG